MKHPELLAPVGNFETLEAAIIHGADAVYGGVGSHNLRARATNFTLNELKQALRLVKGKQKKFYLTLNSMPSDTQLEEIEEVVKSLASFSSKPDAIIISDPGVLALCKEVLPGMRFHLSTQVGVFNRRSIHFWALLGITRVILPRELTLNQVRALTLTTSCETEIFIHGAMCVSISGRCLMGAYMANRHPNQGDCPQPCRWQYKISELEPETGKNDEWLSVEEDTDGIYLFNAKDLNTLSILPQIIHSGVQSLKIEGRNKSVHYVSTVVKIYKTALEKWVKNPQTYSTDPEWFAELDTIDHRPYTTGFYNKEMVIQEITKSKERSQARLVGIVKALIKGGKAVVDVKNPFRINEKLNILPVSKKKVSAEIIISQITDLEGNNLTRALTNRLVIVHSSQSLAVGDIIRKCFKGIK